MRSGCCQQHHCNCLQKDPSGAFSLSRWQYPSAKSSNGLSIPSLVVASITSDGQSTGFFQVRRRIMDIAPRDQRSERIQSRNFLGNNAAFFGSMMNSCTFEDEDFESLPSVTPARFVSSFLHQPNHNSRLEDNYDIYL